VGFHNVVAFLRHWTIEVPATLGFWEFAGISCASVTLASLLATFLVRRFAPPAAGGGVLPVKLAFWRDFGDVPLRTGLVKFAASALTLGGGVSLGPEGPVVQVGASAMSAGAGALGVARQRRRLYSASGAAAALAAVFNAPMAAIAFVLEEIIGDLSSRLIGAVLLAAAAGAFVAHALIGPQPAFQVATLESPTLFGALLCPLVAAAGAAGGVAFQCGSLATRRLFLKRTLTGTFTGAGGANAGGGAGAGGFVARWLAPALGALGTWAAGMAAFAWTGSTGVFGIGYGDITGAISGAFVWHAALVLAAAKLVASFLASGSGGCGGIFAPSFCIGGLFAAALSAAVAAATDGVAGGAFTLTAADNAMLVMTGMCAGFVAVVRAPVTAILLIFEVTRQFETVPFLLVAALVASVVSRHLVKEGMYDCMLRQDGDDPLRVLPPRDYRRWLEMPVGELANFRPVTLDAAQVLTAGAAGAAALRDALATYRFNCFPVVDVAVGGTVRGMLTRPAAELALATGEVPRLEPAVWAEPSVPLGAAQDLLVESPANVLCIGAGKLVGILTLHDLVRAQETLQENARE
ncbi:MAG: chloride channel protein, partial [Puniceicoccales bacterium]|nr:chloride channel protein [Puniceicoccales bacterium]